MIYRALLVAAATLFSIAAVPSASRADVVSVSERYLGTNPTKMRRAWCANFMNMMERKVGRPGTGSNLAASFLRSKHYKKIPRSELRRGDIVYNSRRGGGHVSYFIGWVKCKSGKCARTISGNTSRRVKYATRPARSLVALRPVGGRGGSVAVASSKKLKKTSGAVQVAGIQHPTFR